MVVLTWRLFSAMPVRAAGVSLMYSVPEPKNSEPCACGNTTAAPDGYCHWCRGAEMRDELKCPDDDIDLNDDGYCAICGRIFEDGEVVCR